MTRITSVLAALAFAAGMVAFAPTTAQASTIVCHTIYLPFGVPNVVCLPTGLPKLPASARAHRTMLPVKSARF